MCWGDNTNGQLGDGTILQKNYAVFVTGLAEKAESVYAGGNVTCARLTSGYIQCWGQNSVGQLGNPTLTAGTDSLTPTNPSRTCAAGTGLCALNTARSNSNGISNTFKEVKTISGQPVGTNDPTVQGFAADSDGLGTVVAVSLQKTPGSSSTTCSTGWTQCTTRLHGMVRNSSGTWLDPGPIDSHLTMTSSSYYQDSSQGGSNYPTPQIVFTGNRRFLAAAPVTEADGTLTVPKRVSLYVYGYTVGQGWDSKPTRVATFEPWLDSQRRLINDIKLITDKNGNAALLAQSMIPYSFPLAYAYQVMKYEGASGQWSAPQWIDGTLPCPHTQSQCTTPRLAGAYHPDGSVFFLFPSIYPWNPVNAQLYTTEFE